MSPTFNKMFPDNLNILKFIEHVFQMTFVHTSTFLHTPRTACMSFQPKIKINIMVSCTN